MERRAVILTLNLVVLIGLCVHTIRCEAEECTAGPACFPSGVVPDEVTEQSFSYYCCLQRNMTRHSVKLPDDTYNFQNCSCVLDLTMESKIINWAQTTRQLGRMCAREEDCGEGATSTNLINRRFLYCCFEGSARSTSDQLDMHFQEFDAGDKEEFMGCRCAHSPVPTPDPRAYIVPPAEGYNSTGESCSYDERCQDQPSVKCHPPGFSDVTFCCYGSRGMVTQNDENAGPTRCTCTDEVYGDHCEFNPRAIADTSLPCLTDCDNRMNDDTCTDNAKATRCCPHNMAMMASQSDGAFTSCTCKAQAIRTDKNCDTSLAARFPGRLNDMLVIVGIWWLVVAQSSGTRSL